MKKTSRRRFLYGAGGAAMALPWMNATQLARASGRAKTPAAPIRIAFYYLPELVMLQWNPINIFHDYYPITNPPYLSQHLLKVGGI